MRSCQIFLLAACASLAILVSAVSPAVAEHVIGRATFTPGASSEPELAVSTGHYTAVAHRLDLVGDPQPQVAVQLMPTDPLTDEIWPEPVVFGPGELHKICWSRDGFTLIYAREDTVWGFHAGHDGDWDLDDPGMWVPGGEITGLDIWGVHSEAAGPAVFIAIEDAVGSPGQPVHRIHYTARGYYTGWWTPTTLIEGLADPPYTQVSWVLGPAGPWPAIYYLADGEMYRIARAEVGWHEPWRVPVSPPGHPSPIQGEFDVACAGALGIFGLGPQPTCPCGTAYFVTLHNSGGWQPLQNVTVPYNVYDWPFCPRIDIEAGYVQHLFWYQLETGPAMIPQRDRLEYRIYHEGEWTDAGDFLQRPELRRGIGLRVDIGVAYFSGRTVLAWSKIDTIDGQPQLEQVYVARSTPGTSAPPAAVPDAVLSLVAWPNPFNPLVNLAVEVERSGSLRLDIFDGRGRWLRRLHEGSLPAGRHVFVWDGDLADGRPAASGVYLARASGMAGCAVHKLVLAE